MEGVLEAMEVGTYFYTQDIVISLGTPILHLKI